MAENLNIFGTIYSDVSGIKAYDENGDIQTYIKPEGNILINTTGQIDVSHYATASANMAALINNQDKEVSSATTKQVIYADAGYTGLNKVTVNAMPVGTATTPNTIITTTPTINVDNNGLITATNSKTQSVTPMISSGYIDSGTAGTITVEGSNTQQLTTQGATTYTPTTANQTIASGTYLTGVQTIAGDADLVASNIKQGVNIFGVEGTYSGSGISLQTKSVNPTESQQEITPDSGYDGLSKVTIGAISSTYIGSGIDQRDETNLTVSGATVTVPSGYYAEQETKTIDSGALNSNITYNSTRPSLMNAIATVSPAGYIDSSKNISRQIVIADVLPTQSAVTITPTESEQTAVSQYKWTTGDVKVGAISSTYVGSDITQRDETDLTASGATVTVPAGYYAEQASKDVNTMIPEESDTSSGSLWTSINATTAMKYINIPEGYNTQARYARISASAGSATTPATTITANPSISINSNGLITATASATQSVTPTVTAGYVSSGRAGTVTVSGSNTQQLSTQAATTITPTESSQTAVTAGKYTTGAITVSAIPSNYVGSEIDQRDGDDLTVSGATVSVPAGYYAEAASKSVASGTAGTPTATKGTVSNHAISVTPSVTNTTGYITGGTKTGTAVTVSASELVSGTLTISSSGTKDVTNYASASVNAGTATNSGTASVGGATVTAGTNNITLSKSVPITPDVTAGYISSGTSGNVSVSLTASVTTKAAATITPTTSNQTIASGTYLTGTQTIAGDANLVGSNIISGKSIFGVSGTVVINKYYTGSSTPNSSLGNDGDIYLQN